MYITKELETKIINDIRYKLLFYFETENYTVIICWFKAREIYKCFYKNKSRNIIIRLESKNLYTIIEKLRGIK